MIVVSVLDVVTDDSQSQPSATDRTDTTSTMVGHDAHDDATKAFMTGLIETNGCSSGAVSPAANQR